MFKKATKQQSKLRLLLEGTAGSGKTYSALLAASVMGKKIAVIDTEKGSASLYSDRFSFDVCELLPPYEPEKYIKAIKFAESEGYDVIIIDSISHEWSGDGGCLDIQTKLGGRYQDWGKVTPRHEAFKEALLQSKTHIIATARTKTDYAITTEESGGKKKTTVEKLGLKAEQRDGLEYEFTTVLRLNQNHVFESSKDRTGLFDGKEAVFTKDHAKMMLDWLNDGVSPEDVAKAKKTALLSAEKALKSAKTLDDLKAAWMELPNEIRAELEIVKDDQKAEIELNMAMLSEKPMEVPAHA